MKPIRERSPIAVGLVGLAFLAAVAALAFYSADLPVIGGGHTYTANFTDAAGLRPGNEVRVAGVKVGKVTDVSLAGDHVRVRFKVKGVKVGRASTAAIKIKTLLGAKYLALDPLGTGDQGSTPIPASRTTSPYDVTQAFTGLVNTVDQIDTNQLEQSFQAISDAFGNTSPNVHAALSGLSALSKTISSRDTQLAELLANTRKVTATLSGENSQFQLLLSDGNLLLSEVQQRRDAINALLTGTQALATQLSGVVADNSAQLAPTLRALDQVTTVLQKNQANLDRALSLAGTYYRLLGNAVGNGRWFDAYLCGLVPNTYLPVGAAPAVGCAPPKPGGGH